MIRSVRVQFYVHEKLRRNVSSTQAQYIHLCEFREKVRQYCINKFVRTTLLSKNIILFENNTYILVKKFGRRTLRESNDSVKHYIYTIKKNWVRSATRAQARNCKFDLN